jgi:hypothetical protein
MNPFWSQIACELSPYVPGEQPRIANLVKLNTNESPFGPSPLALEAMRAAAADTLRLYPHPEVTELREALAAHHGVKPEQVFVGNGSNEVFAHAFVAPSLGIRRWVGWNSRRRCATGRCWCVISRGRARRPICASPSGPKTTPGG